MFHRFRFPQWGQFELLAAIGVGAITAGNFWLTLIVLCLLATRAVLPMTNAIIYWPIGLACVVVASYIGSWVVWFGDGAGVDVYFAQNLFFFQLLAFFLVGHIRSEREFENRNDSNSLNTWQKLLVSIPATAMVTYATIQLVQKPFGLMGAYFGGGDHMNHAGMIYRLTTWTAGSGIKSPLNIYAVPDGLHFLIANLVGLASSKSASTPMAQVILSAAWFEWLQAAAFVQLALVLMVGLRKKQWVFRTLVALSAILVASTVDLLVLQFMWAGFTTSLGICWILLVPIAVLREPTQLLSKFSGVLGLLVLAYLAWIVYQPYALVLVLPAIVMIVNCASVQLFNKDILARSFVTVFVLFGIFLISLVAGLLVFGTRNEFVQRLVLSGATYEPYIYTVLLWVLVPVSAWVLLLRRNTEVRIIRRKNLELIYFLSIFYSTAAAIGLVINTSSFGLFDQPYYTQKMLWIILFVSIPIGISGILEVISPAIERLSDQNRIAVMISAPLVLAMTPITTQKYPVLASEHTLHEWIGRSLAKPTGLDPSGEVAFSQNDPQGTYIANLALQSTSKIALDTNLSLSDNPYLVCRYISTKPVSTVFTRSGGKNFLIDSGCPTEPLYIESGTRIEQVPATYPMLPVGHESTVITNPALDDFLDSGFRGDEGFIRWATGLRSVLRLKPASDWKGSSLDVGFIMSSAAARPHQVTFRVNGIDVLEAQFVAKEVGVVRVPLVGDLSKSNLDIEINCDWKEDEIRNQEVLVTPPQCLGVTSLRLSAK